MHYSMNGMKLCLGVSGIIFLSFDSLLLGNTLIYSGEDPPYVLGGQLPEKGEGHVYSLAPKWGYNKQCS